MVGHHTGSETGHISDDGLERYAMGAVRDAGELAALEEHLLACGECIDRAEAAGAYVKAMRTALKNSRTQR